MAITDYFSAEPLLIERLKSQIDNVKVVSTSELSKLDKRGILSPVIHVMYAGDNARAAEIYHDTLYKPEQQWLVILSVRDVRSVTDGQRTQDQAGLTLVKMITALNGYKLSADHSVLKIVPGIRPQFSDQFAHYPIQFTTRLTL